MITAEHAYGCECERCMRELFSVSELRASYERLLDVAEDFVLRHQHLETAFATPRQQATHRALLAFLLEAGRRIR